MAADSDQHLHWLVWLSPLGWVEESRPLTSPDPAALLPVLLLVAIVIAVTVHLAGGRDLGAAAIPGRDVSRPHMTLLGGPTRLAVRLMRPAAIGWLLATTGFALLLDADRRGQRAPGEPPRPARQPGILARRAAAAVRRPPHHGRSRRRRRGTPATGCWTPRSSST